MVTDPARRHGDQRRAAGIWALFDLRGASLCVILVTNLGRNPTRGVVACQNCPWEAISSGKAVLCR